jgi:hypothetical protein
MALMVSRVFQGGYKFSVFGEGSVQFKLAEIILMGVGPISQFYSQRRGGR